MCRNEESEETDIPAAEQASIPWNQLKLDVVLIISAVLVVSVSLVIDIVRNGHDYFQRSGV